VTSATGGHIPDVVASFLRGFDELDVDLVISSIAPNFHYTDPFTSLVGVAKMERFCRASFKRFSALHIEVMQSLSTDSTFACEWLYSLTTIRAGVPQSVSFPGSSFVNFQGARLTHWHDYWDGLSVMSRFGVAEFRDLDGR
jgi:limonene-1,2-epoxide hydrolase